MPSIFISHEKSDRDFVSGLQSLFKALGFEPWVSEEEIQGADHWEDSIRHGLESADWFVLVASSNAAHSPWVKTEVSWALENRKGRVIPLKRDDIDESQIHLLLPKIQYLNFAKDEKAATNDLIKLLVAAEYSKPTQSYVESLTVEVADPDGFLQTGAAMVRASLGCKAILDWTRDRFTWNELRARMSDDPGKGTFWINEMRDVMADVIHEHRPQVMTSTFRGRGGDENGQIFRPRLRESQHAADGIVFHFDIDRVLTPEHFPGNELIGLVYFLLHIVSRVRWEVLEPFFVNTLRDKDQGESLSEEDKARLINTVSGSLRLIEAELDRHIEKVDALLNTEFQGEDQAKLLGMLRERSELRKKITNAITNKDYATLMDELREALKLNIKATALLTKKLAELAAIDEKQIGELHAPPVDRV